MENLAIVQGVVGHPGMGILGFQRFLRNIGVEVSFEWHMGNFNGLGVVLFLFLGGLPYWVVLLYFKYSVVPVSLVYVCAYAGAGARRCMRVYARMDIRP